MTWWQVRADLGEGEILFSLQAEDQKAAVAGALQAVKDVLVPLNLEITEIPPPEKRDAS